MVPLYIYTTVKVNWVSGGKKIQHSANPAPNILSTMGQGPKKQTLVTTLQVHINIPIIYVRVCIYVCIYIYIHVYIYIL